MEVSLWTIRTTADRLAEGDLFYKQGYKKPWIVLWFEENWIVCCSTTNHKHTYRLSRGYPVLKPVNWTVYLQEVTTIPINN
jgi:hypothetical protein